MKGADGSQVSFDVSAKSSVVKARRHFVRNVLSNLDVVCYLPRRGHEKVDATAALGDEKLPSKTSLANESSDQNTGSAA
jgi:hypothetical protein